MTQLINRVGVVGCGLMGAGITEVCARSGYTVIVREVNRELMEAGITRIRGSMDLGGRPRANWLPTPGMPQPPTSSGRPISMRSTPAI